jgi:hypothetical protein
MPRRHPVGRLIGQHFGAFRKSQRKTLTALVLGLLAARRLGLAAIARGMTSATTVRHRIKRVWRFAGNERISHHAATQCLVGWLLSLTHQEVVVALDWTELSEGRRMLAAKAALSGRAVPLAWTIMHKSQFSKKRKSRNDAEEQMIVRLNDAFGARHWMLVADRGFARADLLRKLHGWGIRYVIRAASNVWVEGCGCAGPLGTWPRRAGLCRRYNNVLYHKSRRVKVNLAITHGEPAPEPWYLVTNVEGKARKIAGLYRRRMWIEESFRDAKSNLGLRGLWLCTPERMERLLIVMAVAMLLCVLTALKWRSEHGREDPQLSTKRRGGALSVFRQGLEWLQQYGFPPGLGRLRITPALENLL